MDAEFIAMSDTAAVEKAALSWAQTAESNRLYSMDEIASQMFGAEYDTEKFWRVACNIGPAISSHGFKKVYWKNRRFWIKSSGFTTTSRPAGSAAA